VPSHLTWWSASLCFPRSQKRDPSTPLRKGSGALKIRLRFAVPHPSRKNKDAARVGHPGSCVPTHSTKNVEWMGHPGSRSSSLCFPRCQKRDPSTPLRTGSGAPQIRLRFAVPHPSRKNKDAARVGHPGSRSASLCFPRSQKRDPSTPLRTGSGAPQIRLRFAVPHPSRKNKDAARVGHPGSCVPTHSTKNVEWMGHPAPIVERKSAKDNRRSFDSGRPPQPTTFAQDDKIESSKSLAIWGRDRGRWPGQQRRQGDRRCWHR
jgi:hypothetical protein